MTYILSDYCQLFRNKNRLFYSELGMVIIFLYRFYCITHIQMKFVYTFKQNVDTKQQYKEKKFSLR